MPSVKINEKGVLPIPLIIGAVVLLALAVGGYLFMSKSDKGAEFMAQNAPGMAATILNDKCEYNDPDLCKFLNNWAGMTKFRAKSTMSDKDQKIESTFEMDGDKKTHMMTSMAGKENYNVITLDLTTYTKDYSDNKWFKQTQQKVDEKELTQYKADFTPDASAAPEAQTKFNKLGKEACGNLECFKYEVVEPTAGTVGDKQFLWFDDKEYKLRKLRMETNEGITEMEYSYDGISITEPSPVKEGKPGEMMPVGTLPQMSEEDKKMYEDAMKKSQQKTEDLPSNDSFSTDDAPAYGDSY